MRSLLARKNQIDQNKLAHFKPNPGFQEAFIRSTARIRLIFVGNQEGKGQLNQGVVLGVEGFVEMGSLQVGDTVFDEQGQPTPITAVHPLGVVPVYRLHFDDDVALDVTEDHLWKIIPRKWQAGQEPFLMTTQEIFERYQTLADHPKNHLQIPMVQGISFPKRKVTLDPYILGILLGNGCLTQAKRLSFTTSDPEHVEALTKITPVKKSGRYGYRLPSCTFTNELEKYGLIGHYAHEKFVPKEYLYNEDSVRMAILQGLMDTDGHQGTWLAEYCTTSPQLAQDVMFLLRSFGQKVSMWPVTNTYPHNGEKRIGREAYRIQVKSSSIPLFRLQRKQPKHISTRTPHRIIRSIEIREPGEATCISVESPLRTYVASDFIVTHNSAISAYESACYALGEHPHKQIRVPNTGLIVTAKALKDGVEKDILPKFAEICGSRDILAIKKNAQGIPHKIIWRSGSVTFMHSAEQDNEMFEGSVSDYAWFDEPFRREIFIGVRRGLMKSQGHLWWAMTPLEEPWIYEELYLPAVGGNGVMHIDLGDGTKVPVSIEIFEGQSGENVHIPAQSRAEFSATLSEDERQTRIHGKFRHLSGRVFRTYQPDIHRVPSFDIPKHWPVWCAIDPHRRKPHAVVFLAVAPTGVFFVCNEIYLKCEIDELGYLVKELMAQYYTQEVLIDTSAQEKGWGVRSAREMLADPAGPDLRTKLAIKKNIKNSGIMEINQLFENKRLFVMEHCVRTHRELQLQVYKKNRLDKAQVLEEPMKKHDDCTDALRYILAERPDFRGRAEIKTREAPYGRIYGPDGTLY